MFFDCYLKAENKREFLKKFSIKTKNKKETLELKVKGNINVISKKVNFKNISMNNNYNASKEDLKYFKNAFEIDFLSELSKEILLDKRIYN